MEKGIDLLCQDIIGFDKLIGIGDRLSINEKEHLEFLIADHGKKVIAIYLENITDGRRLMNLAETIDKPVIVLKANRSSSGNKIVRFNDSILVDDDLVVDSAFKQAGIHRVQNIQEMIDCIKIYSLPLLRGQNLAILCRSAGFAVMLSDAVKRHGFEFAQLSEDLFSFIKKKIRAGVIQMTNPLDLGDIYDINIYSKLIEMILKESGVDGLVFSHLYLTKTEIEATRKIINEASKLIYRYNKPVVFCMVADNEEEPFINQTIDYPIFEDIDNAMKALAVSYDYFKVKTLKDIGKGVKGFPPIKRKRQKIEIRNTGDIFKILQSYHLSLVDHSLVRSENEALKFAKRVGYPVTLKSLCPRLIYADDLWHNISNPRKLKKALTEIVKTLRKNRYDHQEFIVQKMVPRGESVFIGGSQDSRFGPIIYFGIGGIFFTVLKDISIRVAPFDKKAAHSMINEIKGSLILKGFRGQPASDIEALAKDIVNASRLLVEHPEIKSLGIDLIVLEKGKGCIVEDAKMEFYEDCDFSISKTKRVAEFNLATL